MVVEGKRRGESAADKNMFLVGIRNDAYSFAFSGTLVRK
jgi:hypothetical protein